ncbi:MAG: chromate resistance protein [Actinomycetota bacterium]|nr:chromate resistance protein [Actinomycetota bacterium]
MTARVRWVVLSYRLPREPSTPRIAVWRRLKRLGVAQLGDGLVALPLDARTREALEWVAEEVRQADGDATLWLAEAATADQERALARQLADARAAEYRAVLDEVRQLQESSPTRRTLERLRRQLRRINRRDYFPPPERDSARTAVARLAARLPASTAGSLR